MNRALKAALALAIAIALLQPPAAGQTPPASIHLEAYQPVRPLATANITAPTGGTLLLHMVGGSIVNAGTQTLINKTLELTPGSLVLPHIYAWHFNLTGTLTISPPLFPPADEPFTITVRALFENMTDQHHELALMGFTYSAYKGLEFRTYKYTSRLFLLVGNGTAWTSMYSNSQLEPGKWYILTAVYNVTSIGIIINGSLDASKPASGLAWDTSKPLYVSTSSAPMHGYISYLALGPGTTSPVELGPVPNTTVVYDPTFYTDGRYVDVFRGSNITASNVERVPDNATWYWEVRGAYSDGLVHFAWAPDGYAYYVYNGSSLVGIYYNGDAARLNGTYRVVLAPAPPKGVSSSNYGGVILYGLEPYSIVEFWLGTTRIQVLEADASGVVTTSLPAGNYTVKVYPPRWSPQEIMVVLGIEAADAYVSLNITPILQEYGYTGVASVDGAADWGYAEGVLYLANATSRVTVHLTRNATAREPPRTNTTVTASEIISNGTVNGQDVFQAYENGTIYPNATNVASAKFILLNTTTAEYTVMVKPGAGSSKTGGGIAVAYLPDNATVYAVRLQSGADKLAVELESNGAEKDVYTISYTSDAGKWYAIHVRIYANGTLQAWANNSDVLTWQLPSGAKLVLGPYIDDDRPLWDFANVTVTLGAYQPANYTVEEVVGWASAEAQAPAATLEENYTATLSYRGGAYAWLRVLVNGTPMFTGVAGNVTLLVQTLEDGVYNVTFTLLDPITMKPLQALQALTRVDARPPTLRVVVLTVIPGTSSIVFRVEASEYANLSASINGTPVPVHAGDNTATLPALGRWYELTVVAVDQHNRATIAVDRFYAAPPGEVYPVNASDAAAAISGFLAYFSSNPAAFIENYLETYTWGLWTGALAATIILAVYLKTYSPAALAAATVTVALWLGAQWALAAIAPILAYLGYRAWAKSR